MRADLVRRYGDYILFQPPVRAGTWLLWFGPLLFVLVGGVVIRRLLRRDRAATPPVADDDTQEW